MPDVNRPTLLVTDQHASVLKVIHAARQHPIAYSPFGHAIHNRQQTLCGFNGQIHEQHAGTYLLGHGYRGFSTGLLRFKGPDSLSPFGAGGLNAYAYCRAEPVNQVDPSGHAPGVFKIFSRSRGNLPITPYSRLTPLRVINKKDVARFREYVKAKYNLNLGKKESKAVFKIIAREQPTPPVSVNSGNLGQESIQPNLSKNFDENLETLKQDVATELRILENESFRIDINEQSSATYGSLIMKLSRKKLTLRDTHSSIRR